MTPLRTIFAATTLLLLAACGETGTYYEATPAQVKSRIMTATLPHHIVGSQIARSRTFERDGQIVTALVAEDGRDLMHFISTVTPEGAGSRVATDIELLADIGEGSFETAMAMNLMDQLADEHVAAAIEGRPFNMMFATNPAAVDALPPEARQQVEDANAAMQAMNEAHRMNGFGSDTGQDDGWADDSWVTDGESDWNY